jgi:hypothetical protein
MWWGRRRGLGWRRRAIVARLLMLYLCDNGGAASWWEERKGASAREQQAVVYIGYSSHENWPVTAAHTPPSAPSVPAPPRLPRLRTFLSLPHLRHRSCFKNCQDGFSSCPHVLARPYKPTGHTVPKTPVRLASSDVVPFVTHLHLESAIAFLFPCRTTLKVSA